MAVFRVLVVEDDPVILLAAAETLRVAGLLVVEAETADAGAALLRDGGADIGAVFTDVETPGTMSGLDLARLVSQSWPSLPVVVTSGRVTPCAGSLPERACFVGKPYDIEHVTALIIQLAEEPTPRAPREEPGSADAEPNVVAPTDVGRSVL